MTFAFGETVTLHGRTVTGQDGDGNDVYTDAPTIVANVPVWPRSSAEQHSGAERTQGQNMLIVGLTALLPVGTNVAAVDKVTVYGNDYEVDGEPGVYRSPFTNLNPGVLVNLTRVTG